MIQAPAAERVVRELRRRRAGLRPRPRGWEYIAWVEVIVLLVGYAAFGLWLLVGGPPITGHALDVARAAGPASAGIGAALLAGLSVRSGLRGGPLSIEPADVQQLLLAPVDRRAVLLPIGARQLARAAGIGLVAGGIAGILTAARLPGGIVTWTISGAVAGSLAAALTVAPALIVSGRRIRGRWANAAWLGLLALGGLDLLAGTRAAPSTWLGLIALWPLGPVPLAAVAIPIVAAIAAIGLAGVAGTSVEALDRRSGLAREMRFAASTRDVRAVTRAGHQLAGEVPRARPWLRLPPLPGLPVTRRHWQSLLRWQAGRAVRVALMAAGVAAALALAWAGGSFLIVPAGILAYAIGLEVLEPLAQELERPDLTGSLPVGRARLLSRHLPAAVLAQSIIGLIALAAVAALRPGGPVLAGAAILLVPIAIASICAAAVRVRPSGRSSGMAQVDPTGMTTAFSIAFSTAGPPSVAILGLLPVLWLRGAAQAGQDVVGPAITGGILVAIGALTVLGIVVAGQFFMEEQ